MQKFKNGYALLIGVGGDLPGSANDAQLLYDILTDREKAAYPINQVQFLKGKTANYQNILNGLDRLIEQSEADPDATIIIYYSGHGGRIQSTDTEKFEYYLLPYDYVQSRNKEFLLHGTLVAQKINAIKAKKLFVIFDCCHAQGITGKDLITAGESFQSSSAALISMLSGGEGKVILASSKDDELSWELKGQGIFTKALEKPWKVVIVRARMALSIFWMFCNMSW